MIKGSSHATCFNDGLPSQIFIYILLTDLIFSFLNASVFEVPNKTNIFFRFFLCLENIYRNKGLSLTSVKYNPRIYLSLFDYDFIVDIFNVSSDSIPLCNKVPIILLLLVKNHGR